jgi:hypothetical protein
MSGLAALFFYCRHRELCSNFWRLRLICRNIDRAVQGNVVMWGDWVFGSSILRDPPLAIVYVKQKDSHSVVTLAIPNRKLIGDQMIYGLRRSKAQSMKHRIREYQIELHRRWRHVKLKQTDEITAECKPLTDLIEWLRQKQLEYGIFID